MSRIRWPGLLVTMGAGVLSWIASGGTAGCGAQQTNGVTCRTNEDCPAAEICAEDVCRVPMIGDAGMRDSASHDAASGDSSEATLRMPDGTDVVPMPSAETGPYPEDPCPHSDAACEFYSPWKCASGDVFEIVDPCEFCGLSYFEPMHQCRQGCRIDLDAIQATGYGTWGLPGPEALCEENRPKNEGDPCEMDADCEPTFVRYENGTYLPQTYLACDLAARQCVIGAAPVIPGYMQNCGIVDAPAGVQVVSAPMCPTGLCLVAAEEIDGCRPQGCTAHCSSDADCPSGSICREWTTGSACKPGYVPSDLNALTCSQGLQNDSGP